MIINEKSNGDILTTNISDNWCIFIYEALEKSVEQLRYIMWRTVEIYYVKESWDMTCEGQLKYIM